VYYKSENYVSHSDNKTNLGLVYKIYDIVRYININFKFKVIKKYHLKGNLLDYGCGLGYFLNAVKLEKSFIATGIDVSEDARNSVKKNFGIDVLSESQLSDILPSNFDVITQWHVLEHVYNLNGLLKEFKRLLKPNGTIFIAVPNADSWDAKYYGKYWDGYDVPRHIYHFNKESFTELMKRNNFSVEKVIPMVFDGPYVSIRSEVNKKSGLSFIKGMLKGLYSNINGVNKVNHSSLIFVVKHS